MADSRRKCRACGRRASFTAVSDSVRLPGHVKAQPLEMFMLGVPLWRQRFTAVASLASIERIYDFRRACCAWEAYLREQFAGTLQCDEATFDGARHGKRGWGAVGKVIVFGIVKRNGCVKAITIATHNQAEVMRQIQVHTREGPLYYTDQWQAYATLRAQG